MGHSEGIMRPLMLTLGATLLVGAPALIALDPVLLPAQVRSQELKHWITATGLDTVTLLFGLVAVLLIAAALGVVFDWPAVRARMLASGVVPFTNTIRRFCTMVSPSSARTFANAVSPSSSSCDGVSSRLRKNPTLDGWIG